MGDERKKVKAGYLTLRFICTVLLFGLLFASCEEDNPAAIIIDYPVEASIIEPCCINFQWTTSLAGNYQLTVADNDSFSFPILDTVISRNTIITQKEFLYSRGDKFEPSVTYYWRVKQGSDEATASFTIKDILAEYQGNYNTQISKNEWGRLVMLTLLMQVY